MDYEDFFLGGEIGSLRGVMGGGSVLGSELGSLWRLCWADANDEVLLDD